MTTSDKTLKDTIVRARCRYITRHPFWGMLGLRIPLVESTNVERAGTDGRRIYYNPQYMSTVHGKDEEHASEYVQFVVAHEIYHIILDSEGRRGSRDHKIWNIASDYIINRDLKEEFPCSPEGICYSNEFRDVKEWYAERVYEYIRDNHTPAGGGRIIITLPSGKTEEAGDWDDHVPMFPGETPEEREEATREWRTLTVKAYQAAKLQGFGHGYMQRLIDQILNPRLPWRALLSDFVADFARDDYSWEKLDPTYLQSNILMPSLYNLSLSGVVAVDTSGSISQEEAEEFIGEVAGITSAFPGSELVVIFCDDAVHNEQRIRGMGELDLEEGFREGGGGTSFDPVFKKVQEEGLSPNFLVYLTDGYPNGSWPKEDPGYSCLWVVNNESCDGDNIHFGRIIRMVD